MGRELHRRVPQGGETFVSLVVGIIPLLIVLLTAVHALIKLIGPEKIDRVARWPGGRPALLPDPLPGPALLAVFFLTNPMCYTMGRFLPERDKPAFYDSAVSFVHPPLGLFPHVNAGELFVWAGIAAGITTLGLPIGDLAVRYFYVGLIVIFMRGIVTETIGVMFARRASATRAEVRAERPAPEEREHGNDHRLLNRIGRTVGGVVGTLYQSGREAIDMVIRNVLPFMAFISLIIGFILATGIGEWIADRLTPLASSLIGLLVISIICSLPVLAAARAGRGDRPDRHADRRGDRPGRHPAAVLAARPVRDQPAGRLRLHPGRAVAGRGRAGDGRDRRAGGAVLRMVTGPAAVVIAYLFSFGLYTGE